MELRFILVTEMNARKQQCKPIVKTEIKDYTVMDYYTHLYMSFHFTNQNVLNFSVSWKDWALVRKRV